MLAVSMPELNYRHQPTKDVLPAEADDGDDDIAQVHTQRRPALALDYAAILQMKEKVKNMSLKHQLVIWKKTSFLLDNIAFTHDLCSAVIKEDLFSSDMMAKIMNQRYDSEKILVMLSYLGCHGDHVYEKFLRALEESKHDGIAREIRRTERYTKFGEQLPAVFHYFLNLSEFIQTYPHIGVKLGEDEKHLLTSFIDGHIEIGVRKYEEKIRKMSDKIKEQRQTIRDLRGEIKVKEVKEKALREAIEKARTTIETLKAKLEEAEEIALQNRNEARRLRHFRVQQEELLKFIGEKAEEYKVSEALPRQLTEQIFQAKDSLFAYGDRNKSNLGQQSSRQNSTIGNQTKHRPSVGSRQNSKVLGPRQNTKTENQKVAGLKPQPRDPEALVSGFRVAHTQVNLLCNKIYYLMTALQGYEGEDKRLKEKLEHAKEKDHVRSQLKRALLEVRKEKTAAMEQLKTTEKEFYEKEAYVNQMRREIMGIRGTPADAEFYRNQHDSLVDKMQHLLLHMRKRHDDDLQEQGRQHQLELDRYLQHMQELKNKHIEEESKLKLKIRMKIMEINDREKLIARLKKQITTMVNYHSKNMNASIPVEECRKITRSIIGEARKLKAIADEKAREQAEIEKLEAMGVENAVEVFEEQKRAAEEKKRKKQEKRKRKKKPEFLADDRLRYLADRLCLEWRILGKCLGFTNNRMDMVEWDCPPNAKQDFICMAMLKSWRDDENGKVADLVEALKQMSRDDLAIIVLPVNKMHLLRKKKKEGEGSDEDEEDDEAEGEDDDVDVQSDTGTTVAKAGRDKVGKLTQSLGSMSLAGMTTDGEDGPMSEAETVRSNVPKLPNIGEKGGGKGGQAGKAKKFTKKRGK